MYIYIYVIVIIMIIERERSDQQPTVEDSCGGVLQHLLSLDRGSYEYTIG